MHGLVQDRLPLHDVLLDRVGEELALELRIFHQEHVAQRHDIRVVCTLAEGKTEVFFLLFLSRPSHEVEHMAEKLVEDEKKQSRGRQRDGEDALGHGRDLAAALRFARHVKKGQSEICGEPEPRFCKEIAHHSERLSPVSMPAFKRRSRTMSSVFPATSGRRSAMPSAVAPMKSSARMLFAILWSSSL